LKLPLSNLIPDEDGMVKIISSRKCSIKFSCIVPFEKAVGYVREGGASVLNNNTIVKYYSSKQTRNLIFKRDKGICHYCGKPAHTLDHLKPRSKGGYSTPKNLVCCCYHCNQKKSNLDYDEFLKLIENKPLHNRKIV
jgi:hypothetical protein